MQIKYRKGIKHKHNVRTKTNIASLYLTKIDYAYENKKINLKINWLYVFRHPLVDFFRGFLCSCQRFPVNYSDQLLH